MPSEVAGAVQRQRDAHNDAQTRRDNINRLIKLVNDGLPRTLDEMRKHDFPIYRNRGFEVSSERVNGKLMPVWKFTSAITYQRIVRATGSIVIEHPGENVELGIVFKENASGQATHTVVVGRWNQHDDFRVLTRSDYERMEPFRIRAIVAVLAEMCKQPGKPKHVVDWVEPPTTEADWHKPIKP